MGKCKRQGCKEWGTGFALLDASCETLCDDHRDEFDKDPASSAIHNEAIRLKGAEQRALAIVYSLGDDDVSIRDHEDAIEQLIAHRMACKAFVAEFMARPAPAVPEAAT